MAITSRIAPGYLWRNLIIAVACLVFGVWGVYDFWIKIPTRQRLTERIDVLEVCKTALETPQPTGEPNEAARLALELIAGQMKTVEAGVQAEIDALQGEAAPTGEELRERLGGYLSSSREVHWLAVLQVISQGLGSQRSLPLNNYPAAAKAHQICTDGLAAIGPVSAPAAWDRTMQWLFIACLPFAPFYLWSAWKVKKQVYTLDDDGTLHLPRGTFTAAQIADIDMSRWMSKSIATLVGGDGQRVQLDDYKHKNLHLIIGAVAARLHPGDWTVEAKPAEAAGE